MDRETAFGLYTLALICIPVIYIIIGYKRAKSYKERKGKKGESVVSGILNKLGNNYIVIDDLVISHNNVTTQIDHIVLSKFGIFIIETKNLDGWIFGKESDKYWVQNIWGNKYSFYNPIIQNHGHIIALNNILPRYTENQYVSIIAFSPFCELKNKIREECNVVYFTLLTDTIKKYTKEVLSYEQICTFTEILYKQKNENNNNLKEHIKSIKKKL